MVLGPLGHYFSIGMTTKPSVYLCNPQLFLAGDVPDRADVGGLPDGRAQRHGDRRRLRAGAGRAAGGRRPEAGEQDAAPRLHLRAPPRTPRLALPLRRLPLCPGAQVGSNRPLLLLLQTRGGWRVGDWRYPLPVRHMKNEGPKRRPHLAHETARTVFSPVNFITFD